MQIRPPVRCTPLVTGSTNVATLRTDVPTPPRRGQPPKAALVDDRTSRTPSTARPREKTSRRWGFPLFAVTRAECQDGPACRRRLRRRPCPPLAALGKGTAPSSSAHARMRDDPPSGVQPPDGAPRLARIANGARAGFPLFFRRPTKPPTRSERVETPRRGLPLPAKIRPGEQVLVSGERGSAVWRPSLCP